MLLFLFVFLSTISGITVTTSSPDAGERLAYGHAYYLFLSSTPVGCEDCYVPLLITKESLEEIAQDKANADCALITTYERDSIWHNEGLVSVAPTDIEKVAAHRSRSRATVSVPGNQFYRSSQTLAESSLGYYSHLSIAVAS